MKKIFSSFIFFSLLLIQSISLAADVKVVTVVHYGSKDISPAVSVVWGEEVAGIVNAKLLKFGIEADTIGGAWESFAKEYDREALGKAETYFKWQNVLANSYDTIVNVNIDKYTEKDGHAIVSARMSVQRAEGNMSAMNSSASSRMVKGSRREVLKQVLEELSENVGYMLKD